MGTRAGCMAVTPWGVVPLLGVRVERIVEGAVGVGMFNLRFGAGAAASARRSEASAATPPQGAAAGWAATELRHTLRSLCDLALAGDPSTPEQFTLGPAVRRLAAVMPFPVQVNVDVVPLAPAVSSLAYAVICESLANAAGHAGARRAVVTVRRHGPTVQIAVSDDGAGGATPVLGGGIVTLAARAAALGGLLHVDSPAGSGTHVSVELPRGVS